MCECEVEGQMPKPKRRTTLLWIVLERKRDGQREDCTWAVAIRCAALAAHTCSDRVLPTGAFVACTCETEQVRNR